MSKGRLEQIAAPDELYTDPATAFVAEFVGVMNRIPGELQAGGQVTVLGSTVPVRGHRPDDTAVDVLVRPEGLHLEIVENGNGIVTTRTFLGLGDQGRRPARRRRRGPGRPPERRVGRAGPGLVGRGVGARPARPGHRPPGRMRS
jgi:ABC-type Fe3+/spermidine/putrescine transport system ATPase subunit